MMKKWRLNPMQRSYLEIKGRSQKYIASKISTIYFVRMKHIVNFFPLCIPIMHIAHQLFLRYWRRD